MDVVAASIPLFFALIALEVVVARRTGDRVYRLNDSIADLSCGILSELAGIGLVILTYAAFAWLGTRFAIQRWLPIPAWPDGAPFVGGEGFLGFAVRWPELASWAVVFLLVDFAYYWMHRLSHEVHILWAGHVVHHSSEEYNLTVALRQSAVHGLFSWVFYAPLALLGVPWIMFAVCHGLNLIYQFWIHTREIGRLGPMEAVFNTPSHHRVHHGVNPKYQDRNYAGVLIIWDKWFGSFQPEEEEPVYGITVPLESWNPLWANVHVFAEMFRNAWRTTHWRDKLKVLFGPPSWRPADIGPPIVAPDVSRTTFQKFDPDVPPPVSHYVAVQFVALLAAAMTLLRFAPDLPVPHLVAGGFYVLVGLNNLGTLLEGRRWVRPLEFARLAVLITVSMALVAIPRFPLPMVLITGGFGLASMLWFARVNGVRGRAPSPA